MVERTGVDPEAPDRPRPSAFDRAIHEPPAGAPPLNRLGEPVECEFAVARLSKIELQKSLVATLDGKRVDLDAGVAQDRLEIAQRYQEPGVPKPFGADAAKELAVPQGVGLRDTPKLPGCIGAFHTQCRHRQHFEAGHYGCQFAVRDVAVASRKHHIAEYPQKCGMVADCPQVGNTLPAT